MVQNAALITRDLVVALISTRLLPPETTNRDTAKAVGEMYCIIYDAVAHVLSQEENKPAVPPDNTTAASEREKNLSLPRRLSKPLR